MITFIHYFVQSLFWTVVFIAALTVIAHAQQTQTRCYDAGPTKVCETKNSSGVVTSESRCYKSGSGQTCDTRSFGSSSSSSTTTTIPVPSLNPSRRP